MSLLQDYLASRQPQPVSLHRFVNDTLEKLSATFQIQVLNQHFIEKLPRINATIRDNEGYMRIACVYGVPDTVAKIVGDIQCKRYKIVEK
jgi:hypothetical protein